MTKYDAIVIGSGLGGLICGALLSKAGRKVCVLEKSNQPGGCMQSYKRGNFCFDTGLHYVGGLNEGHPLHKAFEELGLIDLPWQRMDERFDHVIIGDREFSLSQGDDNFVNNLAQHFPLLRSNIQAYVDKLHNITPDDMDINAWQWLKDTLKDDLLVDIISAPSMKVELKKDSLPLFSFLHSNMSYIESSWRLQGDGNMIVERLISLIRQGGGEIKCNCGVTSLNNADDVIKSVRCTDGSEYQAEYFISDIHPTLLCSMMENEARKMRQFKRRMQSCENTFGIFTTSLLLKPEALRYRNHNAYIYKKGVWDCADKLSEGTNCVMVSSRHPEHGEEYVRQIDLLTPMSWEECKPWADTLVGHRGGDYKEMCHAKAAESIRLAERFIPALGDMVEKQYTSSPLTYRDYLSAPEGSAFGIRKDYRNSMLTYHSVKTPYPNLFLTGQNIMLSGIEGVTMTAIATSEQVTSDE